MRGPCKKSTVTLLEKHNTESGHRPFSMYCSIVLGVLLIPSVVYLDLASFVVIWQDGIAYLYSNIRRRIVGFCV